MNDALPYENPSTPRGERIALCLETIGFEYSSQPKEFIAHCNLCGGATWTIITHRDRYGLLAPATACAACSLTVLNPRLNAAAYGEFYNGIYRPLVSAFHGRRIDARTIQDEQREYAAAMGEVLAPYLEGRRSASLIDVGGSTGIVAAHLMRRFGLRATVLDPAPAEVDEAKALGIETVTAFIEDWDAGEKKYDVVGMFQTIDHLLDVAATLEKLRAVIAEDGLFIVDIVDFRAAYLRNHSVEAAVKIDHPFSLTEDTTEALLARAGFSVLRKSYSADHLHIAYVCKPSTPVADAMPNREAVRDFFREIRFVQNALRSAASKT